MLNIGESAPTRRLIVLGGGGFMMEGGFSPIDRYLVESGGVTRPRICLIATPVGDAESVVAAIEETYKDSAEPWVLAPFRKVRANGIPLNDIEAGLCRMHVVFVSGGNTRSALAVWREWGIDTALRRAYESGVVISGMSGVERCGLPRHGRIRRALHTPHSRRWAGFPMASARILERRAVRARAV